MTGKPDKEEGAPAGAPRGNLEDVIAAQVARQLSRGSAGASDEGREAHAVLADMIRSSNVREPYRQWLAWMHEQIAAGVDARIACAVMPGRGNFSKLKRDIALWQAIDRLAFEDGVTPSLAAKKLLDNPASLRRLAREIPDLELPRGRNNKPPSVDTLVNIYRRIEKLRHE